MDKSKTVTIFSGTIWEAELLSSLLQDAGIESFLMNSINQTYYLDPIRAEGVKVLILDKDLDVAEKITSTFIKKQF